MALAAVEGVLVRFVSMHELRRMLLGFKHPCKSFKKLIGEYQKLGNFDFLNS
jgi:hypothetical protein